MISRSAARRHPRPPFRGRSDQGVVRVRRRRRQFRVALHAGHRLRPAPSSVRRGCRRAGRMGPCDRRHGLDHPGDGARLPRGGRRHRARTRRSRKSSSTTAARRAWSRAARLGARNCCRGRQPEAAVRPAGAAGRGRCRCCQRGCMHWKCESATFRMNVALSELPKFTVLPKKGNHLTAGHHHGAEPRLHAPRLARRGGQRLVEAADHRNADPLDARSEPCAQGQACRVAVLPAFPLRPRARPQLGQRARKGGGRDHRDRRCAMRRASPSRSSGGKSIRRSTSSGASG